MKNTRARRIGAAFVCASLLFPSASINAAMSTPVAFQVGESGAASAQIQIRVPPGTSGMAPALSLAYSSQGGNGLMGMGWSLGGLSAITRCPATIATDNARGAVNFDANDKFCMDGQRLIAVVGTYGANGTEYRTERDSFTKIYSWGTAGTGPAWFQVYTKSGQRMELGNTADSRVEAVGKTTARTWAVNKISDTVGNYMTVTYTDDQVNGDHYPTRIDYTGNAGTVPVLTPGFSVQFVYEARPDSFPAYHAGSLMKSTKRLKNVQTFTGATLVTDYQIAYETSASSSRTRVTNIKECVPGGVCLPQITMGWQNGGGPVFNAASSVGIYGGGSPADRWFTTADVNADGKGDAVLYEPLTGYVHVWLSNGNGTFAAVASTYIGSGGSPADRWFTMGDMNGDGAADAVLYNPGNGYVNVALSNGSNSFQAGVATYIGGGGSPGDRWFQLADVNGDGRADAVLYNPGSGHIQVGLSGAGGTMTLPASTYFGAGGGPSDRWFTMADVNGDGKSDAVLYSLGSGYVTVGLSNGNGFGTTTATYLGSGGTTGDRTFIMGDFNGDGKADALLYQFGSGNLVSMLSTGDGLFTATTATYFASGGTPSNRWFVTADVNADGRADAVLYEPTSGIVNVALSTGSGAFAAAVGTYFAGGGNPDDRWFTMEDFNGDGKPDVVLYQPDTSTLAQATAAGAFPDLLLSVTDAVAGTRSVTYKPLTDPGVYSRGSLTAYPTVTIQAPMYVAGSLVVPNGIGGTLTTSYLYQGAKVDQNGRGMLGFAGIWTYEPIGTKTYSVFSQTWPYIGMPTQVQRVKANNAVITQVDNIFACKDFDADPDTCTVAAGKRYFPYVLQSTELTYDLNGAFMTKVRTGNNLYDLYGNATQIVVTHLNANDTPTGYSKTTNHTYAAPDTSGWILGRVTRSTVQSVTP